MSKVKTFIQALVAKIKNIDSTYWQRKITRKLFGMRMIDGLVFKVAVYVLLISLGYIYLYPMLYMVTNSFMSANDLISFAVRWIPSSLNWENYKIVWEAVNYPRSLLDAFYLAALPAIFATLSSALIGYGFARFNFPFKKLLMVLMIMTFIVPPQITMLPMFRMFSNYGLLGSVRAFIYPAILGQGLNGAIYILIFYSFFKMIPKSLEESAQIDGAGPVKIFMKITLPLSISPLIIVLLFSFVWYYNETYLAGLYLRGSNLLTLPLRVEQFFINYTSMYPEGSPARELMQAAKLAGNVLALLPLLILYFFTQKHFVESIDKTGITGE